MSVLTTLEQRKHDLRVDLVHSARVCGLMAPETLKIHKKLERVKAEEWALLHYWKVTCTRSGYIL